MTLPVCLLKFKPSVPGLPFQVAMATDVRATTITSIDPNNFTPNNTYLDVSADETTQSIVYVNDNTQSKMFQIRNISQLTPGAWSETTINNQSVQTEGTIPYSVTILPSYVTSTMDIRWILTDANDNIYGPYIGDANNVQYVPPGIYTMKIIDLSDNLIFEQQINTNDGSTQVYIPVGLGSLIVIFNVPNDTDIGDFSYSLISDFTTSSMSQSYNNQVNDLENGLYYLVIQYQNKMLQAQDSGTDFSVYIYTDVTKTLTVDIVRNDGVLQVASISE